MFDWFHPHWISYGESRILGSTQNPTDLTVFRILGLAGKLPDGRNIPPKPQTRRSAFWNRKRVRNDTKTTWKRFSFLETQDPISEMFPFFWKRRILFLKRFGHF